MRQPDLNWGRPALHAAGNRHKKGIPSACAPDPPTRCFGPSLGAAALADGRLTVTYLRNGVPATRALVGRGAVAEGAVQIELLPGRRA